MAIETQPTYSWKLAEQDVGPLAEILGISTDKIAVREQLADSEAPICGSCGREIGLLDYVTTALSQGSHGTHFLEHFFVGGDMTEVATPSQLERVRSVEHDVNCYSCGELQNSNAKWILPHW